MKDKIIEYGRIRNDFSPVLSKTMIRIRPRVFTLSETMTVIRAFVGESFANCKNVCFYRSGTFLGRRSPNEARKFCTENDSSIRDVQNST